MSSQDHRKQAEAFEHTAQAARQKIVALQTALDHERSRVQQTITVQENTIERLRGNLQVSGVTDAQVNQYKDEISSVERQIEQLRAGLEREELSTQTKVTQLQNEEATAISHGDQERAKERDAKAQEDRRLAANLLARANSNDPNSPFSQ